MKHCSFNAWLTGFRGFRFGLLGLMSLSVSACFHTIPITSTTTTATIPNCSGAGCCCNSPIEHRNPGAGNWPDCDTGYTCKGMQPGGVVHPSGFRLDVNVCQVNSAPLTAPLFIKPGEPSFCRTDI